MAGDNATDSRAPAYEPLSEVRLAIVMYGGSSLAIYINGVAQELLTLVKATAPASRSPDEGKPFLNGKLKGTEQVYRKLGQLINGDKERVADIDEVDPIRARFVVDIITGSSAGGINGIFLSKALAGELSMDDLKNLWVREGDIGSLINDAESSRGLPGLATKDPPKSLLNSDRMFWKLLQAFEGMDVGLETDGLPLDNPLPPDGQERPKGQEREVDSRLVEQLDLYVTATDISGLVLNMKLTDEVISEPRHRNVYHFVYSTREATGSYRNDFTPGFNPFLAFAARCTSSLPFVFEPMRLDHIDEMVSQVDRFKDDPSVKSDSPRWHRLISDYVVRQEDGTFKTDFAERSFGDGGSLDNSPFSYATDQLNKRGSNLPVTRKLLYVEPDPKDYETGMAPKPAPDAIQNVLEQMVLLPRTQTIREDLDRLLTRNRQIQRIQNVLKPLQDDIRKTSGTTAATAGVTSADIRSQFLEELLPIYGVSYGTYQRLRVAELTDDVAHLFTRLAGLSEDSDDFFVVRYIVRAWRDGRYVHFKSEVQEGSAARPFSELLVDLDMAFALRRLHYVREAVDKLLAAEGYELLNADESQAPALQEAARATKRRLNELLTDLRKRGRLTRSPDPENPVFVEFQEVLTRLRGVVANLVGTSDENLDIDPLRVLDPHTETLRRGLVQMVLARRTEADRERVADTIAQNLAGPFQKVMDTLTEQVSPVLEQLDVYLDEAPADEADSAVRAFARKRYEDFVFYDLLAHPLQSGSDTGETDVVQVYRVSPIDARGLIDVRTGDRKKVAGAEFGHFGAFFDSLWRKNDIMWGRLDGAERLIQALVPQGDDHDENVDKLREEAYGEILWAELSPDDKGQLAALMADVLAQLPPESRTTQSLLDFIKKDNKEPLDDRFDALLRTLLNNREKLTAYYRDVFTLDAQLPQPQTLRNAARATHVTGQVLKSVTAKRESTKLLVSPMGWVARIGRLFTGAVEAATPGNLLHIFVRHWLVVAYIIEAILILGGGLFGQRAAQQLGWSLLWITIAVSVLLALLEDVIRGGGVWKAAIRMGFMLLLLAAVGMVVLEWSHLSTDLSLDNKSLGRPPNLWFGTRIVDNPAFFFVSFALLVVGSWIMSRHGRKLRHPLVKGGIVSFQMAGARARALEILTAWGPDGQDRAKTNLYMDFVYIPIYAVTFYAAVVWATAQWAGAWELGVWIGVVLAVAQLVAAALDVVENLCLLTILGRDDPGDALPKWARVAAQLKFLLLGLGALYALVGLVRHWVT